MTEQPIAGVDMSDYERFKGGIVREFRVVLPLTVDEYQVGQLYSVAEASKNETGGGEGIEVVANEPFDSNSHLPYPLLGGRYTSGQYTHKIYHLQSKVPAFIRLLAPKGALEIKEEAWNAYPYCRTVISNPNYMKDKFHIVIDSLHLQDRGTSENVHHLCEEELKMRDIVNIDIGFDPVSSSDYKESTDPTKFKSTKTGRGPLEKGWQKTNEPVMCAYKLVRCKFQWFGLQNRIQSFIMKQELRLFSNFHREVFCWIDKWHGLTMADIREIEEQTKKDLDKCRREGSVRGIRAKE